MNKKDSLIFIEHILESVNKIEKFSRGISKENLFLEEIRKSAIVRELEVIGEAVKNLPIEFINKYPSVPWADIARTRDKLIHHYFGVDLEIVWKVIKEDLPQLKGDIKEILKKEKKKNGK